MSQSAAASRRPELRVISSRAPEVLVRHPDTREPYKLSLEELVYRVEASLGVELAPAAVPLVVAMADALFLRPAIALERAAAGRGVAEPPRRAGLPPCGPAELEGLLALGVAEAIPVEEIYRTGRWEGLERPRTWELNGWWEALYGVIPMPPAQPEELDADEDEDDDAGLPLGVRVHPVGLEAADNQARLLLERGLLAQTEVLVRLRVSVHEQARALAALREGWEIDEGGALAVPGELGPGAARDRRERLARIGARARVFEPEALAQLLRLGLVRRRGERYLG